MTHQSHDDKRAKVEEAQELNDKSSADDDVPDTDISINNNNALMMGLMQEERTTQRQSNLPTSSSEEKNVDVDNDDVVPPFVDGTADPVRLIPCTGAASALALCVSKDGHTTTLVAPEAQLSKVLCFWTNAEGKVAEPVQRIGHDETRTICASPRGDFIVSGGGFTHIPLLLNIGGDTAALPQSEQPEIGELIVWDATEFTLLKRLSRHIESVKFVLFDQTGTWLASACQGGSPPIITAVGGEWPVLRTFPRSMFYPSLDCPLLAFVPRVGDGQEQAMPYVVGGAQNQNIACGDIATGQLVWNIKHNREIGYRGGYIKGVISTSRGIVIGNYQGRITVIDSSRGSILQQRDIAVGDIALGEDEFPAITCICKLSDSLFATGDVEGNIHVWNVSDLCEVHNIHISPVVGGDRRRDVRAKIGTICAHRGSLAACGSWDGYLRVW